MNTNFAQRLIELLNRFFGPRNQYFESMMRSAEETFEYSMRAGAVVYDQFHGYNDLAGKVVLDFGCGGGGKTVYYAAQGPRRTIGVDCKLDAGRAREFARTRGLAVEFLPLEPDGGIPLPDDTCDVVINSSVLEHVDDPGQTFRELRRVLRPDGLLLNRWHPFRSRYGAHLWAAIGIPFAHLLFREVDLVQVYYRNVVKRFGEIPRELGPINSESTTFADLAYLLNRRSVREMRRAVEAAGFEIRSRRHFWKRQEVRYPRYLPEAWIDYTIDYEVQICVNRKETRVCTAPPREKLLSAVAVQKWTPELPVA